MTQTMAESRRERREWLAQEFERHRAHLRGVAYRMLGSMTEADDAVQEAWVRLDRRDPGGTDDLRGWLTVTVGRICLDMLRTRASRRETYAGTWLPEPIVSAPAAETRDHDGPEGDAVLADSVGLALALLVPAGCYIWIAFYGIFTARNKVLQGAPLISQAPVFSV